MQRHQEGSTEPEFEEQNHTSHINCGKDDYTVKMKEKKRTHNQKHTSYINYGKDDYIVKIKEKKRTPNQKHTSYINYGKDDYTVTIKERRLIIITPHTLTMERTTILSHSRMKILTILKSILEST
jgi:hypothetical protein